ncbi:hypothetical protein GCM10010300_04910 [Streptomyces olivaceoviridis]|nr:hypothetical protein GCM10010300_04910 [Streptomyces olivaceoviridis]
MDRRCHRGGRLRVGGGLGDGRLRRLAQSPGLVGGELAPLQRSVEQIDDRTDCGVRVAQGSDLGEQFVLLRCRDGRPGGGTVVLPGRVGGDRDRAGDPDQDGRAEDGGRETPGRQITHGRSFR